jgi:hypothetical protein
MRKALKLPERHLRNRKRRMISVVILHDWWDITTRLRNLVSAVVAFEKESDGPDS